MKICLINPPQILKRNFEMPCVFQPLGLLYVASSLMKHFEVEIIDASLEGWRSSREVNGWYYLGLNFEEIAEKIKSIGPDVVGISIPFSINEISALKAASAVKAVSKNIITILGGAHPSVRPLETLSFKQVDFIVIGEGEHTTLELVQVLKSGNNSRLKNVNGIGYKENGQPIFTLPRNHIQDLDTIPFPARNLIPMQEYFSAAKNNKTARQAYNFNERQASIITSRGCPYHCNFCSIHLTMGRQFRPRSPENVIVEIKEIIEDYGVRHINFEDDNLTLDRERAKRIFDLMIENNLGITWSAPNGIRADSIDEALVKSMKNSGCKRVFVAPESGVQRVVSEIIGKNLDLRKIEEAVILFKKYGIIVDGSFVIGSIGETKSEINESIRYALRLKNLGMRGAAFHIATPYYGTPLYEEAKQKGFLRKDLDNSLMATREPLIVTPDWDLDTIEQLRDKASRLVNSSLKDKILRILWYYPKVYISYNYPRVYKFLRFTKRLIMLNKQ